MHIDRDLIAAIDPRVRLSPFFAATMAAGLSSVSTYNHMWMPISYGDLEGEYTRLTTAVSMWDVAAQRHLGVSGPDADRLVQKLTVIDVDEVSAFTSTYAPMVDVNGQLINDPVLFCFGANDWRFSVADGDLRLWMEALAAHDGFNCKVAELPTATLALQGPRAHQVLAALGLGWTVELDESAFRAGEIAGVPVWVSNSGWSSQGGVEILLDDIDHAEHLWNLVAEAGQPFGIGPGAPNAQERIENVLLSYGTDTGYHATPYELGLGDLVNFSGPDFVGRDKLLELSQQPPTRVLRGVVLDGEPMETLNAPHSVERDGRKVGELRSAAYSPRYERNLGLVLLDASVAPPASVRVVDHVSLGNGFLVDLPFSESIDGTDATNAPQ